MLRLPHCISAPHVCLHIQHGSSPYSFPVGRVVSPGITQKSPKRKTNMPLNCPSLAVKIRLSAAKVHSFLFVLERGTNIFPARFAEPEP